MSKSAFTFAAALCGIFCFNLISAGDDSNYEQCYNAGQNRICYHRKTNELLSWNESMQICDSMNSSLPFFQNSDEMSTFKNYSIFLKKKMTISNVWTSGQKQVYDNWTSVNGDIWNNYIPIQFPTNGSEDITHVLATGTLKLVAEKPQRPNLYFCQYPADRCETNDKVYLLGQTCFEISTRLESWFEARNACLMKKGDLLYLINLQDIETLKGIAEENSASIAHFKFWIGLRKVSWIWKSNLIGQSKEVTWTNWSKPSDYQRFSPTELCIYIDTSNLNWRTSSCNERMSVICQRRGAINPIDAEALSTETTKPDWTNYFTIGSVIGVAVLLCVASITIAVLIVRRKSSVAGESTQDDRHYQGLRKGREVYDNYDKMDIDNRYYEDIANLASDCNYESLDDATYLELVDTEVYDSLEEAGDETEADRSSQLENVTEEKV